MPSLSTWDVGVPPRGHLETCRGSGLSEKMFFGRKPTCKSTLTIYRLLPDWIPGIGTIYIPILWAGWIPLFDNQSCFYLHILRQFKCYIILLGKGWLWNKHRIKPQVCRSKLTTLIFFRFTVVFLPVEVLCSFKRGTIVVLVSAPGIAGRLCLKICSIENRFPNTDCCFANELVKCFVTRAQWPFIYITSWNEKLHSHLFSLKHAPTPSQVVLQLSPTDANPQLKSDWWHQQGIPVNPGEGGPG